MRPRARSFRLAAVALALLAAGCAGGPSPDDEPDGPAGPGGPANAGGRAALFISPHGQPFRAQPGEPYPVGAWFTQADRNHDGRLSREEFRADAETFFRSLDANHDGVVDGFEVAAYERGLPEMTPRVRGLRPGEGMNPYLGRSGGPGGPPGDADGGGRARRRAQIREGASNYTFLDQPEPVMAADTDFDSRVSLAEALAAADRRFALLDADGDGYLTLSELPKTPAQAAAERAQKRGGGDQGGQAGRRPARPE